MHLEARDTLLYFELSPRWLWQGIGSGHAVVVVADGRGVMLLRPARADAIGATGVVGASIAARGVAFGSRDGLSWHSDGREWRGLLAPLPAPEGLRLDVPWRVAAFMPAAASPWAPASLPRISGVALLLALLLSVVLACWSSLRYRLPFVELRRAVLGMGRSPFAPVASAVLPRELLPLATAVNEIGQRLEAEVAALEDARRDRPPAARRHRARAGTRAILTRVTVVTRYLGRHRAARRRLARVRACSSAADATQSLPVSRVEMDPDLAQSLAGREEGVTIARCEDERHSFSAARARQRVLLGLAGRDRRPPAAVLAVGFREAPAPDPRFARHGAEFGHAPGIALSKTARDEHLYRQAHFDTLTGLPNRLLFRDRLAQELASSTESKVRGALLYVDLDHFKKVNDTVGHAAGDQLLTIVAQRLRSCVKDGDTVARLGGDEFTVVLRNVLDPESASMVAERIIEAVKMPVIQRSRPLRAGEHRHHAVPGRWRVDRAAHAQCRRRDVPRQEPRPQPRRVLRPQPWRAASTRPTAACTARCAGASSRCSTSRSSPWPTGGWSASRRCCAGRRRATARARRTSSSPRPRPAA
ncbi:MAG: GGDEF domain-containing protein [Steroidobacteraceae bacterium]